MSSIFETLEDKRHALMDAMEKYASDPQGILSIYVEDCLNSYSNSLLNDTLLQAEINKTMSDNDSTHSSNEVEGDLSSLVSFVNKHLSNESKESNPPAKTTRSIIYPQFASSNKDVRDDDGNKSQKNDAYDVFKTAADLLNMDNLKKLGSTYNAPAKKQKQATLGLRRTKSKKFISPLLHRTERNDESPSSSQEAVEDERLKNLDPKLIELIKSEIMETGPPVDWSDIAGLEAAKTAIKEAVVWPMMRPDIFTGLRSPPKGILLFGPPGTGKTLIGKCVAAQSRSTFFSVSASSLTSKWVGEGEKMVRTLFTIARCHQPAIIFIDEIDSLLSQRTDSEHDSSRRIKTEFLVQLDGARTDSNERLMIIGATNRPHELDEAARRRFVKRLYIPLPEYDGRLQLVKKLMENERNLLNAGDYDAIATLSEGYSGADIKTLCSDACLGPIRAITMSQIETIETSQVRPVAMEDFRKALQRVRSSVSPNDLQQYVDWDNVYGSGSV